MYKPEEIKRKKEREEDEADVRRLALLANTPLSIAKEEVNQEIIPGVLNEEQAAQAAEVVSQWAPGVGTAVGAALGTIGGGALGAIKGGLLASPTGPGVIGGAIGGGLAGAGTGVVIGSALGGGAGSVIGTGAGIYADAYQDKLDRKRLEEEARRAQLLNLLAVAG